MVVEMTVTGKWHLVVDSLTFQIINYVKIMIVLACFPRYSSYRRYSPRRYRSPPRVRSPPRFVVP
jgi:hypothetical protein